MLLIRATNSLPAQSNELTSGPSELAVSFIGGVHIGARALHVLNLIWFGYITCLSQWEGGVNSKVYFDGFN